MLHLQEKAHFSLDEFRRGKGSPLSRYNTTAPTSPANDDDELSILGGKTRLVSKKEPESPTTINRSPISHNPIVPLPLSPTMQNQVHPSVLEYLQSFNNTGHSQQLPPHIQTSSNTNGLSNNLGSNNEPYSEHDVSPVSIYGMSTLPTQSYQETPSSYLPQQTLQDMMQSTQRRMSSHQQAPQMSARNDMTFPQYFPVYDYGGASSSSSHTNGNSFGQGPAPILDANPAPGQRKNSGSPDVNMQSTWQDFVHNLAMQ